MQSCNRDHQKFKKVGIVCIDLELCIKG